MKRTETIKDQKVFNHLIRNGKFVKNKYYIIYNEETKEDKIYFGIAISNKVGNAVTRNKLKRQTRVIIDKYRNLFKNRHNYIIMIRKACKDSEFSSLDHAILELLEMG